MAKKILLSCLLFQVICALFSPLFLLPAFSEYQKPAEENKLDKALRLFTHENYEEALPPLQELRIEDPQSAAVAYYLGMTLKQLERLNEARPHLEASATYAPKTNNAVPELIDLLYRLDRLDEAKRWIGAAEKEGIAPSQVAFMKGLILLKENKGMPAAIAACDKAQSLDKSLPELIKHYRGIAYLQMKELSKAKEVFKGVVMATLGQGLAAYANENPEEKPVKEEPARERPVEKKLDKALRLFKHENYEEALIPLQELRTEDPQSAMVAYYLGMTLKRLERLNEAMPHLEAAATYTPRIDSAVPELIDLLYKIDKIDEAKKWIETAQMDGIAPSQVAFMKGLILLKENKDISAAIAAFDKAQSLDELLAGMVTYYKGIAYLQSKELSKARDVFKDVVTATPGQGLALYANEYMDTISRVEEAAKPFHGYAQALVQYDDNVVLMPGDDSAVTGISEKADWRQAYTAQCDYNFKFGEKAAIKPGYSFYYGKQSNLGFYDMTSHDISLLTSFYSEKTAVTFPIHYNYVTVNDKGYLSAVGISNVNNYMVDRNNMAQFSFFYNRKIFLWQPSPAEEARTSNEYIISMGWYRFFAKNKGVFSLSYVLNYDDAQGRDWRYLGNRLIMFSTIPVLDRIKWTIGLDYFNEVFPKRNFVYDKERYDNVLTVSNLVAVEVAKNAELLIQHSFTDDCASLGIYKYRRSVYGAGMKYKF